MQPLLCCLLFFCFACTATKKYNQYVGHTRDYLIRAEGPPSGIKKDGATGEEITYRKNNQLHRPAYLSVTTIVTFYVDKKGEVYKWSKWKYKPLPPTAKPSLAID